MSNKSGKEETVCEFFGLQITTKNPNIANILKTDMAELMNQDVRQVLKPRAARSDAAKAVEKIRREIENAKSIGVEGIANAEDEAWIDQLIKELPDDIKFLEDVLTDAKSGGETRLDITEEPVSP